MDINNQHKVLFSLFFPAAIAITNLVPFGGPLKFSLLALGTLLFFIAFINTNFALVILIFSMLLSPEFKLGGIAGRAVVLRIDDILLFVVFFGWLAKMAVNKELGLLRVTPLNKPILVYIFVCLLSTGVGIVRGTTNPKYSFFYISKYVEYFIIFFMVSNNIRDKRQMKVFLFFILFTCFIVSIYGLRSYFVYGTRATAPFEGKGGESNTFAGYLLLMMGITLGSFLCTRSLKLRLLLGGFLVFITIPFLLTLSRGGWFGFFPMYIAFMIFSKRYKPILLFLLIYIIVVAPFIFPQVVIKRYEGTFIPGETYSVLGREISLDESASARIQSAKRSLETWSQYPILGRGVPGGGVVSDVQYTRVLREVGIIGFLVFIWLMVTLFKVGWRGFTHPQIDDFGKGLSLGFTCALVGLLAMGVAAEVFIIVRIMEPFWFLAAMVVMLPEVSISPQQ